MGKGMGGHEKTRKGETDEWLTPPEIIKALGHFDLDPCSPVVRPWDTADFHNTIESDGLASGWFGRVWLNPPYGPETGKWLAKLAAHNNGIALIFARTETQAFFDWVWNCATAVLFIKGRLRFHRVNGEQSKVNAGAPSVLAAYGSGNAAILEKCGIVGKFVALRS